MTAYWLLFAFPLMTFVKRQRLDPSRDATLWLLLLSMITVIVGWRHQVGADWRSYVEHFEIISQLDVIGAIRFKDPAYSLVNWLVAQLGGGIHSVNFICAAIFSYGLGVFCARQPQPGLALLIAIPYLVIVVSMGYTRQAVAIALMMVAYARIEDRRIFGFLIYGALAALFHKSALAFVPLAALAVTKGRFVALGMTLGAAATGYKFLLADQADTIMRVYFVEEYRAAEGGPVRVLMNALPASLLLIYRSRLVLTPEARRLWTILSLAALAAVPAVFVVATATDRLSLYLIPLQIAVLSRVQEIFGQKKGLALAHLVVIAYAAVLFVWLFFGANARSWLPYQFYVFS